MPPFRQTVKLKRVILPEILNLKNQSGDSFVKNVSGNANASVADGDLTIGDIGGNLTATSTWGDIDFHKVGGMANVNSQDGDIDFFEGIGMIIAQTNSGDITLRKVSGAVDARTEDGDISAEMYSGSGGSSKFYSRDGELEILFSQDAKATVDAKVTGADAEDEDSLSSDFPPVSDKNKLAAKYEINGGGDSILLESVNGEISIRKLVPKPQPAAEENESIKLFRGLALRVKRSSKAGPLKIGSSPYSASSQLCLRHSIILFFLPLLF